jgi:drug/metabolite transporter (DMT)-like permease
MQWFFFGGICAVCFGLQATQIKVLTRSLPGFLVTSYLFLFSVPFFLIVLLADGMPSIGSDFYWSAFSSFSLNILAWHLYTFSIRTGDLSLVIPYISFTPLFMIASSWFILGEWPTTYGFIGIVLIICGGFFLQYKPGMILSRKNRQALLAMIGVAFIWSISGTVEKISVLNSSPSFFAFFIHANLGIYFFIFSRLKKAGQGKPSAPFPLTLLISVGFITMLMSVSQYIALEMTQASYVLAMKRSGILVASLNGILLFKENMGIKKIIPTIMMLIGIFAISELF